MKKSYIVAIATLISFYSCNREPSASAVVPETNIQIERNYFKKVKSSDLFERIEFLELKAPRGGAIEIDKIVFDDGKLFVMDKRLAKGVFAYDTLGNLINKFLPKSKIQQKKDLFDFDVNSETGTVAISNGVNRLNLFDLKGRFLKTVKTPFRFTSFISTTDGYLFYNNHLSPMGNDDQFYNLIQTDREFNVVRGFLPYEKDLYNQNVVSYPSEFHRNSENQVVFSNAFSNTVYYLDDDDIKARYSFDFKGRNYPPGVADKPLSQKQMLELLHKGNYSHLHDVFSFSDKGPSVFKVFDDYYFKYLVIRPDKSKVFVDLLIDDLHEIPVYNILGCTIKGRLVAIVPPGPLAIARRNLLNKSKSSKLDSLYDRFKGLHNGYPLIAYLTVKKTSK